MAHSVLDRKPLSRVLAEVENAEGGLRRSLGSIDLLAIGIGAIVGAGIFVLSGVAARGAGPAVVLSFALAAVACAIAALAYSELATAIPVPGSAYTYTYIALGELIAWLVGWNLILEYSIGAALVASGWSGYTVSVLHSLGIELPVWLTNGPWDQPAGLIDLPAALIVGLLTLLAISGIRESASFTQLMVGLKLAIVVLIIAIGSFQVNPANWQPFMPLGAGAVLQMAAVVFVAYVGFDVVSTTAAEVRNPGRMLPIGIIGSLLVSSVLYGALSLVLTGMVPYSHLNPASPVESAFEGVGLRAIGAVITVGALAGLTSVLITLLIGQPRIFLAMARDGLLPGWAAAISPRSGVPVGTTLAVSGAVAVLAAFVPIGNLAAMTSIGTLLAFALVCLGVAVLRRSQPDLPRPFRLPAAPWLPIVGALVCFGLMFQLPGDTWVRFALWTALGLAIYFGYGRRHSRLNPETAADAVEGLSAAGPEWAPTLAAAAEKENRL